MAADLIRVMAMTGLLLSSAPGAAGPTKYAMTGLVLKVDADHRSVVVSHDSVEGVMDAMAMRFAVRDAASLDGVEPGMRVDFTLVIDDDDNASAEGIRARHDDPDNQDPLAAQRFALLERISGASPATLAVGDVVPDFTLIDQARQTVTLSQFRGKVVAVNFIYTSCALPQFCFRMANHFGALQRRLADRLGRDLVLLTVTFDPVRDQPETLAEYAAEWKADPTRWHFLTGDVADVKRVCSLFGQHAYPDEGLMIHSSRTAIIDRSGRLAASIEGAQFTSTELRDLVETVLGE